MDRAQSFAMQYGYYDKGKKKACCVGYNAGYKQAEKDLTLTWEDIAFICQTCTEVINSLPDKPCAYTPGFKDLYGEVLRRFNSQREKNEPD